MLGIILKTDLSPTKCCTKKKILDAKLLEAHKKFKTNLSKLLNKENCQENCKKQQISMMQLLMNPIWLTFTIKDKRAKGNDLMGNGPY